MLNIWAYIMAYYGLLWQPIMAALGICKHLDIFYDHLSETSLLETTQSLVRFVKNNIFSYSVKANAWQNEKKRQKLKRLSIRRQDIQRQTSNYMGKRWENETAIF